MEKNETKPKNRSPHESKLKELRAEHGNIAHFTHRGKLYAFRAPSLEEFEDYQESLKTKRRGVCFREIAQICLVHPSLEELQALFDQQPAVGVGISDALAELAGADIEVTVKKD